MMAQPEFDADGYPTEDTLVDMQGDQAYDYQQQYGRDEEDSFGFNERSIMDACAMILSAYRLAPFKPYPAVYFPVGWFQDEVAMTRSDREDRILTAIAVTHPFPIKEITDAYDRLKSYDTVLCAVEEATETLRPLSFVVNDILTRRGQ